MILYYIVNNLPNRYVLLHQELGMHSERSYRLLSKPGRRFPFAQASTHLRSTFEKPAGRCVIKSLEGLHLVHDQKTIVTACRRGVDK